MKSSKDISRRSGRIVLLLFPFLALISGCGNKQSVAFHDPVDKVSQVETNAEVLKAWVTNDAKADVLIHIDTSDDIRVFPASFDETIKNSADHLKRKNVDVVEQIASFIEGGGTVNLGYKTGLYKRVIWVLPATASVGANPVSFLKKALIENRGYRNADLGNLEKDGKNISGTLAGIPITVTRLEDLEVGAEETAIIDIDLGYFLGQKAQDEEQRMGTRVLFDFLRILRRNNILTSQVTINLSSINNLVPMDMRFFGKVIEDALRDPKIVEGTVPERYSMMMDAEEALLEGQFAQSEAIYKVLSERYPDDAGLFFSLAVVQGFQGKGKESSEALGKAYGNDTAYIRGFFQLARVLAVNDKLVAGQEILKSSELKAIIPQDELDYQMGLFFFNARAYHDAITYLELVLQSRRDDFALKTVLYKAYKAVDDTQKMYSTLSRLVRLDEKRVIRDMPWVFLDLGILSENAKLYVNAAENYEKYLSYVPSAENAAELKEKIDKWGRKKK
ncbi:MAG: hypothetical protein JW746_09895 [Candidatus Krumholzibacteriota bacterium]|nr:hypothetical protein [Candidatus Krumholzibacteriota bacterium]